MFFFAGSCGEGQSLIHRAACFLVPGAAMLAAVINQASNNARSAPPSHLGLLTTPDSGPPHPDPAIVLEGEAARADVARHLHPGGPAIVLQRHPARADLASHADRRLAVVLRRQPARADLAP